MRSRSASAFVVADSASANSPIDLRSEIEDGSPGLLYSRLSHHDLVIRLVEFSHNIVVLGLEFAETGLVCAEVDPLGIHYGGVLANGSTQPLDLSFKLVAIPRRIVEVLLHLEPLLTQRFDVRAQDIVLGFVSVLAGTMC